MNTIHVLTVGVSLINNATKPNRVTDVFGYDPGLYDLVGDFGHGLHPEPESTVTETVTRIRHILDGSDPTPVELWERLHLKNWPSRASAELTAVSSATDRCWINPKHTAVLLASDTAAGLTAALYNAYILANGQLDRIEYHHEPTADISTGRITICRLSNLDVHKGHEFNEAMRGLGAIGGGIFQIMASGPATAKFHLTGGYRPAMPFLLLLAEALCGLRGHDEVIAYTVPEFGGTAIELPLRRFTRETAEIDSPLEKFKDHDVATLTTDSRLMQGLVYTAEGTTARLTAFGHVLRVLYQHADAER